MKRNAMPCPLSDEAIYILSVVAHETSFSKERGCHVKLMRRYFSIRFRGQYGNSKKLKKKFDDGVKELKKCGYITAIGGKDKCYISDVKGALKTLDDNGYDVAQQLMKPL
jgi:hypothetical protein